MACILSIETSTSVCSVAVSEDDCLFFRKESSAVSSHSALIGSYVEEALGVVNLRGRTLDAVAVSAGPGSYTGLRIGVSAAKGVCFGCNVPLIAVPTLEIMAAHMRKQLPDFEGLFCPMIDARRMEVYAALYDAEGLEVRGVQADIVDKDTYAAFLAEHDVCFFGNGAEKCMDEIASPRASYVPDIAPLASDMMSFAQKAYASEDFVDVAYYEPFYLKEYRATVSKNKVLG